MYLLSLNYIQIRVSGSGAWIALLRYKCCYRQAFHLSFLPRSIRCISSCSGTLSPMNPLIAEFQIPVTNVLENMHVISDSQLMVATVDRSIHNIPLSSSFQCEMNHALSIDHVRIHFSRRK